MRLLAPYDPDDRLARASHRGVRPDARPAPDHLISLGRTVGLPVERGRVELSLSHRSPWPRSAASCATAATTSCTSTSRTRRSSAGTRSRPRRAPVVGTFHCYSTSSWPTTPRRSSARDASTTSFTCAWRCPRPPSWTAQRFYGGRYRIVPNGVDLEAARAGDGLRPAGPLQLLFLGRAEERKGLPVLLRAFEGLRAVGVDARLTVAGATPDEVEPFLLETRGDRDHRPRDATTRSGRCSRGPTCSARPRSAARASAWC